MRVNKNETKETPSSVTVSRKTPGSSTDINQSSPIRPGRTHQPHKRIGLLARRAFHSTSSSSLKRRCVRTYHDVRDDGYDEKNTRRDGTKFNASIHRRRSRRRRVARRRRRERRTRSSESNPFVKSRTESQGDFSNYDPSQIHPKGRNPATGRSIDRFPIRTPTDVPGGVAT